MSSHDQTLPALRNGALPAGRFGARADTPGVTARLLHGYGLATIAARRGRAQSLKDAFHHAFECELPAPGRRAQGPSISAIWTGHDQWLVLMDICPEQGMEQSLIPTLGAFAACVDQTDARLIFQVSGPSARAGLCKGIAIDLDPGVFTPAHAATTIAGHVGITIWQRDQCPTFEIAVSRSYAGSLWDWIAMSSAEFGLEIGSSSPV